MGNFSGKINFLKFKNACVISVKGKTGTKKGIFIPVDDNNVFVSTDDANKAKGAYIDFIAFENRQIGRFGDTHGMKQSVEKKVREKMSEEEVKAIPFFGNMRPYEMQNAADTVDAPPIAIEENADEDLPF